MWETQPDRPVGSARRGLSLVARAGAVLPERRPRELIVASNRLPARLVATEDGSFRIEATSGGLATALSGVDGISSWVGWPGTVVPDECQSAATALLAERGFTPIYLDAEEEREYYGRICNDTIWPLFHYFPDRLRITGEAWERYRTVNERFAKTIADRASPRARVWVHDFHLMLVPAALRRLRPDLEIGFFLHIPFPSSEVYRLLPTREEALVGVLGSDTIGFHTGEYARHFRSACLRVLGLESEPDAIEVDGRRVSVGVDPIGIDTKGFDHVLQTEETQQLFENVDGRYGGRFVLLGVERLDYTKGIPQKLRAFERYLEDDPSRARDVTLLQVLVPSRLQSEEFRAQRDEIELLVSRINGRFGQPGVTPVEYIHRHLSQAELAALYRRADVMLVTPLRDGMNLVAHEFVHCQNATGPGPSHRGALVLSEFAGAARVLPGALLVNPWSQDDMVTQLRAALASSEDERRRRLTTSAARVLELDCKLWAHRFLERLESTASGEQTSQQRDLANPIERHAVTERFRSAAERVVFLDYDGTLRELEKHPELAAPTPGLLGALGELCSLSGTHVHIVSGRPPETLEAWLGHLPMHLCAEHGYVARELGTGWRALVDVELDWLPEIEAFLREAAREVPGTMVETKRCAVAWHYRLAEPEYGEWRARELLTALQGRLADVPAEVVFGRKVIEVRARGVDKGVYVRHVLDALAPGVTPFVLAAGDDRTDRQMLAALPPGGVGIHVGPATTEVRGAGYITHTIATPAALRALLAELETGGLRRTGTA
jgi:trehalose 6-phosphate synthase/phosphatase